MSKVKMRCISCGKWFQSANAKEVTCPDCTQKARKEKLAAKNAPPTANKPAGPAGQTTPPPRPAPPKPKPVQSGTNQWLDSLKDVKVGEPEPPPMRPKVVQPPAPRENRGGPGSYRDERAPTTPREEGNRGPGSYREDRGPGGYREGGNRGPGGYREDRSPGGYREGGSRGPGGYREERGPGGYRVGGGSGLTGTIGQRPRQPIEGGPGRGGPRPERPGGPRDGQHGPRKFQKGKDKASRPTAPPKPKREKTPPPAPFVPTPEQIQQVEERYLELATPAEYDGIRTQISHEMGIPKKAVKKIVKELRERQNIPSWWETQTYKGPAEDLEKIKAIYEPLLPVPPVGVHKTIAEQLDLKPGEVYQAIKTIRLEMGLPQYNDPILHGEEELATARQAYRQYKEKQAKAADEATAESKPANEASGKTESTDESKPADATSEKTESTATRPPVEEIGKAEAAASVSEPAGEEKAETPASNEAGATVHPPAEQVEKAETAESKPAGEESQLKATEQGGEKAAEAVSVTEGVNKEAGEA